MMISKILSIFNYSYFFTTPEDSKLIFTWIAFYLLLLILSIVLYFTYKERAKSEKPYLTYAKTILWVNFSLAVTGFVFLFLRYEKANFLSWRIWHYLILLAVVLIDPYLFVLRKRKLDEELLKYRNQKRKEKWIKKSKSNK